jgi:betaine-aldehyde dehydrogenase
VQRSVFDDFLDLLEPAVEDFRVGNPTDEETEMGPLISADHREKVASFVPEDAPVAIRGSAPDGPGFWYPPTVLAPVSNDDRAAREEIFGPVVAVIPFEDRRIETGVISINSNTSVRVQTPFGGMKQSGVGRELGPHALDYYTEVKNVYLATEED